MYNDYAIILYIVQVKISSQGRFYGGVNSNLTIPQMFFDMYEYTDIEDGFMENSIVLGIKNSSYFKSIVILYGLVTSVSTYVIMKSP